MATIPLAVSFKIPSFQELIFLTAFRKGQQGSNSITFLGYMPIILSLIGIIYHIYLKNIIIFSLLPYFLLFVSVSKATYAREGVFILFFITILSAYGLKVILTFKKPWISKIIIGFVCIELLLGSIYPFSRTDKKFYQDIAQYIQKEFSNQRIVTIHKTQNKYQVPIGPNGGILGQFDIQKLNGPHNLTVPITHNYNVTLLKKVEMDLNTTKQVSKKLKDYYVLIMLQHWFLLMRGHKNLIF